MPGTASNHYVHDLNPIAFTIGEQIFPWYWLVYLGGFIWLYGLGRFSARRQLIVLSERDVVDHLVLGWFALLIGARLSYILLYYPSHYLENPGDVLRVWQGGMSFHGGLVGVALATWWLAHKRGHSLFAFMDVVAIGAPLALAFGRIANFINGELAGRVSDVPWAVVFPSYGDGLARHPSQLYQALTEGFLLFVWQFSQRQRLANPGQLSAMFLMGYGLARFVVEFFRAPDPQLGLLLGFLTMGQLLCLIMILAGVVVWWQAAKLNKTPPPNHELAPGGDALHDPSAS